ncbi:hypothetical protein OHV05_27035 [Kitasatospora sp. NBC_00070]|uniref:hypothetical protein n=1 Tax=Kitasatospora sp. NBC_00070 TaxID=2975962 RepID=UPI003252FCEE
METVLAAAVAVLGTLAGTFGTLVLQRRQADRAAASAQAERLRQERASACLAFAEALAELERAAVGVWLRRHDRPRDEDAVRAARQEADRSGAAAQSAMFRMQLMTHDQRLGALAHAAFELIGGIEPAADRAELKRTERSFEQAVEAFIAEAHRLVI